MIISSLLWNFEFCQDKSGHQGSLTSTFDALSECVNWFLIGLLQFSPNWSHMASHGLSLLGLNVIAYNSETTRNWQFKHWFSDFRCNIACFKLKFLARGCNRPSKTSIWLRNLYLQFIQQLSTYKMKVERPPWLCLHSSFLEIGSLKRIVSGEIGTKNSVMILIISNRSCWRDNYVVMITLLGNFMLYFIDGVVCLLKSLSEVNKEFIFQQRKSFSKHK